MDLAAYVALAKVLDDLPDITQSLETISTVTTVLVGAADAPFFKPSEAIARAIPGARLEIIPEASHCPQYENADAWRETIERHLART